jgi:hypothetical protein
MNWFYFLFTAIGIFYLQLVTTEPIYDSEWCGYHSTGLEFCFSQGETKKQALEKVIDI